MIRIPAFQTALQLTGPGRLVLNEKKPVLRPGPRQFLLRVEAVGLCFSDLKLLDAFTAHPRKGAVTKGISPDILAGIPSYVPGDAPTVPGHEVCGRVVAAGPGVTSVAVGSRYLVQADYRHLPTAGSNAAFGYNFEGGLQEYVLLDERVTVDPSGVNLMLGADDASGASAIALVEPWACVQNAYASSERRAVKAGGRTLVVADAACDRDALTAAVAPAGTVHVIWNAPGKSPVGSAVDESGAVGPYDDIVYAGCAADRIGTLWGRLAPGGLLNIVLCGGRIGRAVPVPVGLIHYVGIRFTGTPGGDCRDGYRRIPETGEAPSGAVVRVIGAGGPMGVMHVVRTIVRGLAREVVAEDLSAERLALLAAKAAPLASRRGVSLRLRRVPADPAGLPANYTAVLAPVPALVAEAVSAAAPGALVNLFAGIPAGKNADLDLDTCVREGVYLFGTSGSLIKDMRAVLEMQKTAGLDTDLSVAAVTGLSGAADGIAAVKNQSLPGKIIVYPSRRGMGLTPLENLAGTLPAVARHLANGSWNREAEKALLLNG